MAQLVVIWCLQCLLLVSSLTLNKANVVVKQEATIVPEVENGGVLNEVDEDVLQQHWGVDVGVGGGVGNVGVGDAGAGIVGGEVLTNEVDSDVNQQRSYHPAAVSKPRIIEQYDHRSLDGQYEYRYVLSNGEARYERAYWLPVGENMILARKGYYSHLMKNNKYLTVFYTADQNGFREDSSTYSQSQPNLPRSLNVPEHAPPTPKYTPVTHRPNRPHWHTSTTTRRPHVHKPVKPSKPWHPSNVQKPGAHHSSSSSSNQVQSSHVPSSGPPSSWGNHHLVGSNAIAGHHPVTNRPWHSSGVYSLPSEIYSQSGIHVPGSASKGVSSGSVVHTSSGAYSLNVAHPSWGQHTSSGVYNPLEEHSASEVHVSSGVHTSSSAQSPSISHTSAGTNSPIDAHTPSTHHSNVHSSPSHSQQHHSVEHVSPAHSTSSAHSPSTVHISSTIHAPSIIHTSSGVHSSSSVQSSSSHHSTVRPSSPHSTVRPSRHPSQQHHSTSHNSQSHSSTAVDPTPTSTSSPVQSWHYSFRKLDV